jgi:hypothetical protein
VPRVSEFFGIAIYMYYREHPPPHFHAVYGGSEAVISIEDVSVLEGNLNPRALGLVVEWARRHQQELREAWERARAHQPPGRIEPLE